MDGCNRTDMPEMQIRRETAGVIDLRFIALRSVILKFVRDKFLQQAQRFRTATAPTGDWGDGAVELPSLGDVCFGRKGGDAFGLLPFDPGTRISGGNQEFLKLRLQPRANGVGGVLRLLQQL